jgi:hypothetical protein
MAKYSLSSRSGNKYLGYRLSFAENMEGATNCPWQLDGIIDRNGCDCPSFR